MKLTQSELDALLRRNKAVTVEKPLTLKDGIEFMNKAVQLINAREVQRYLESPLREEMLKDIQPKTIVGILAKERSLPTSLMDYLSKPPIIQPEAKEGGSKFKPPVLQPSKDERNLNKLEGAWLCELRTRNSKYIGVQSLTLKIGDDCRYTPDFIEISKEDKFIAWEVKGFMRDDALVKLKVAARQFPFLEFWLVKKIKGTWETKKIEP